MRIFAIALVAWCATSSPGFAQIDAAQSAPAPSAVFQPRLVPDVAPPPLLYQRQKPAVKSASRRHGAPSWSPHGKPSTDAEIICGTKVIRPTHDVDPRIRIHADLGQGIRARRIEPDNCGAARK